MIFINTHLINGRNKRDFISTCPPIRQGTESTLSTRPFIDTREIQSGVKFSYSIDIIRYVLLSLFSFGIRFLEYAINLKADKLQLPRIVKRLCRTLLQ